MTKERAAPKEDKVLTLEENLQQIADEEKAMILSFIAPSGIIKVSPTRGFSASITGNDLYNIEDVIEALDHLPKKLFLIIHTPGGDLYASTKIAKYLKEIFKETEITCFVPYDAASGGTMLSLIASKIVMGNTSSLTPIDPQIQYKGQMVSVNSYGEIIDNLEKKFDKVNPSDIPAPYYSLCNNVDPIIFQEMDKKARDTVLVAMSLLEKNYGPIKAFEIAIALVKRSLPHSHVIDAAEAKEIGFTVVDDEDNLKLLKSFKALVRKNLKESNNGSHVIKHFVPKQNHKGGKDDTK